MQAPLRVIQAEQLTGKSSEKTSTATDELQYLLNFNASITQCMAKTMKHLSKFVFINVANMTLARRDAYLAHVKAGIKHDTLSALRLAPIHLGKMFLDPIKEQGFSEAVAAQIEVPQRGSTKSVYEAKWCLSNQVDFRAPI